MNKLIICALAVASMTALAGCDVETVNNVANAESIKAQAAANSLTFVGNAEIDNISRRLKLTSNPGQIGFVLLMNQAGQPIMYTSVKGKITSGSKRLGKEKQHECVPYVGDGAEPISYNCSWALVDAPSDEGTRGHSSDYVFFWTTDDQYVQWNGPYLYSDQPIRTNVAPLVISVQK